MPKKYYTDIIKKHYAGNDSKLRKELSSHLINDDTYYYLMEENFEEFRESRRKEIRQNFLLVNNFSKTVPKMASKWYW